MKNLVFLILFITVVTLGIPQTASAAICNVPDKPENFSGAICIFVDLISTAIPIVASIALLVFFWGLAKFILHAGDESARSEGKQIMIWGIVSLFVLVSVWGIIRLLAGEFLGTTPGTLPLLPTTNSTLPPSTPLGGGWAEPGN